MDKNQPNRSEEEVERGTGLVPARRGEAKKTGSGENEGHVEGEERV